jgi:hypothetical protein
MATYIVKLKEAPPFAVEGAQLGYFYPDGAHVPLITILDEQRECLAVIPGDAVRAVYLKDAETKTEGGLTAM